MDTQQIIAIVEQYKAGTLDLVAASLQLIVIGLNAEEIKTLLVD